MATLILTTVGTAIGGPIGGALGAIAGGAIDRTIMRPAARTGPRLNELKVQTSSYGAEIPHLFGTIRVAGTVIWATDLIETRATDGGGKGAPDTIRYSYSASFAVLLSAGAIRGVRRIWADGKLLRGAAGDFKSATGFRLYTGDEGQAPDPLIASAVRVDRATAMRGQAYAVFEGMALADYANRIPSLTFEVEADAGSVDAGVIAAAIAEGGVAGEAALTPGMDGFSAHGGSRRAVAEMLASATGAWFAPLGDRLAMRAGEGGAVAVADSGCGGARGVRAISAGDQAPRVVTIGHYDAARDYQAGLQRATRTGGGWREQHVELPAVMSAEAAKRTAAAILVRAEADRWRRRVYPGWAGLAIAPGDRVAVEGDATPYRVTGWSLEGMAVELELAPIAVATASAAASAGAPVVAPDRVHGRTILIAAELQPLTGDLPARPQVSIMAAGTAPGWRGASLLQSDDGGSSWRTAGQLRAPSVMGEVVVPPGSALAGIEDRANTIVVELAHAEMALAGADAVALDRGGNLALVGNELIQFARAEALGGRRWRLHRLWRGRRGTEGAIAAHVAGERFTLLQADNVMVLPVDPPIGATLVFAATGVGDGDEPVSVATTLTGASVVPPSPVHGRLLPTSDGGLRVEWQRRSRAGWHWIDGVDAPLIEERERYRVTLIRVGAGPMVLETDRPAVTLNAAECVGLTAIEIVQIGTHGASLPHVIMLEE
ncbi:phage tail protein [Sphingomonas sp. IW22]|uniref:phage tail protein n=1 Tax=Sphingomonas sp. IW22 TaxID=3242489 RepID=UPI003522A08A